MNRVAGLSSNDFLAYIASRTIGINLGEMEPRFTLEPCVGLFSSSRSRPLLLNFWSLPPAPATCVLHYTPARSRKTLRIYARIIIEMHWFCVFSRPAGENTSFKTINKEIHGQLRNFSKYQTCLALSLCCKDLLWASFPHHLLTSCR